MISFLNLSSISSTSLRSNVSVNVPPLFSILSTHILSPWATTIHREMAKSKPAPPISFLSLAYST